MLKVSESIPTRSGLLYPIRCNDAILCPRPTGYFADAVTGRRPLMAVTPKSACAATS